VSELETRLKQIEDTLDTLILWLYQSAVGVLSYDNANQLLEMRRGPQGGAPSASETEGDGE
jgi:hypothetical protein